MKRERVHRLIDLLFDVREDLLPQAPTEAIDHLRRARREGLLGVRALVDHALNRCEDEKPKAEDGGSIAVPVE